MSDWEEYVVVIKIPVLVWASNPEATPELAKEWFEAHFEYTGEDKPTILYNYIRKRKKKEEILLGKCEECGGDVYEHYKHIKTEAGLFCCHLCLARWLDDD